MIKTIAIILFLVMYVLLLTLPKIRSYVALGTALLFIIIGVLPFKDIFAGAVDWATIFNVLLMLGGTMGVVFLFIESKMPALLADLIIEKTPNVKWAIVSLALFSGVISAFVDNVATVLMVAPVALMIAKKLNISPVPSIISIAIASNVQGAATLVGDTTSILLGAHAKMSFADFFWYQGRPGLFFIVELGALAATAVLLFIFRKEKQTITPMERTVVTDYFPSYLMIGIVLLLITASFFPSLQEAIPVTNGLICLFLFLTGIIRKYIKTKDVAVFKEAFKEIDFQTLLLLFSLFIVIAGITNVGIIADIGNFLSGISNNVFVIYTIIVLASVLLSAVIDNIPYVATMLPIATAISVNLGIAPELLYFGLLIGSTLGGNITPIGASANITGIGILRKEGYEVKAGQFMKISVPFTLIAVLTGYLLVWLVWFVW